MLARDDVTIRNLTSEWGFLALSGPRSREILASVTRADLSNRAFPWLSAREATVADRPCLLLRVSFTGELGWELHMPLESMEAIYDALCEAGQGKGLLDIGGHALNALRIEKGYPGSQELTPEIGMVMAMTGPGGARAVPAGPGAAVRIAVRLSRRAAAAARLPPAPPRR